MESRDSGHAEKKLMTLLFCAAGVTRDPAIVDASKQMLFEFSCNQSVIDADLRPHVFRTALENGGSDEVNSRFLHSYP